MGSQLTYKQILSLAKYLDANRDHIHTERPSYAAVARQASIELGFECSENDVGAAAEACELAWKPKRIGNSTQDNVSRILARALLEIADALDVKVDRDVRRIAMGRHVGDAEPMPSARSTVACGSVVKHARTPTPWKR